jgi:hypothetical protein
MLHLLSCAAIAAPIVAYLVPFAATSRPRHEKSANTKSSAGRGAWRVSCAAEQRREWAANEFAFGRAIEQYEDLIDRIATRLP